MLGAGASMDSGLPLGDDAADSIISACSEAVDPGKSWDGLTRSDDRVRILKWPRFEIVLSTIAKYIPAAPKEILETFIGVGLSRTQRYLGRSSGNSWLWLTTNFDDQIEQALRGRDFTVVADRAAMLSLHRSRKQYVIKLHGDSSVPEDQLGATIDQILRVFPEPVANSVLALAANRPLLCIGYATRDPDLRPLVRRLFENASLVVCIDPQPPKLILDLVKDHSTGQCFIARSPDIFRDELDAALAPPLRQAVWEKRIVDWAAAQQKAVLAHAIAAICVDMHDSVFRAAAEDLLNRFRSSSPLQQLWEFETKVRLLSQTPAKRERLEALLEERRAWVERESEAIQGDLRRDSYVGISTCCRGLGEFETACAVAQDAVALLRPATDPGRRVAALCECGLAQIYSGGEQFEPGLATLRAALECARQCSLSQAEAKAAVCLAIAYIRADRGEEAESILGEVEEIVREIGDSRGTMEWVWRLAEALRIQGKYRAAADKDRWLLEEADIHDDFEMRQAVSVNLGLCLIPSGEVREADRRFRDVENETRDRGRVDFGGNATYNRGWLRVILGEWEAALPFFLKSFETYREQGNRERAGGALALAGWCHLRLGQIAEANNVRTRIQVQNIVPVGGFRADFMTLELALEADLSETHELMRRIDLNFTKRPERQMFLLIWLLEHIGEHRPVAKIIVDQVVSASARAFRAIRMPIYASVLQHALADQQLTVPQDLADELRSFSPRDLRELVAELVND